MTMTRDEMINRLIKDKIEYYVYAGMTDDLEDLLYLGFDGFENWSNTELKKAVDDREL